MFSCYYRPIDDKSCPTPTEPIADAVRGDGGMQRFARTVTGMFNTFKTALPGNAGEQLQPKSEQWIFIENEVSVSLVFQVLVVVKFVRQMLHMI